MADQLKKQRQSARASFTRTLNELKTLLAVTPPVSFDIQLKFDKLRDLHGKLQGLDNHFLQEMLDGDCSEADYAEEEVKIEKYDDEFREIRMRVEAMIPRSPRSSPPQSAFSTAPSQVASVNEGKTRSFKLPKIELPKFNGEVKEWLGFWAQFKKIHQDKALHESDKFAYLMQCIVPDTRAKEVVSAYQQTSENYPKVVKALQERFGKPKMLKRVYVRELLGLVIKNNNSKVKVSDIFDKLEGHLNALESLEISAEQLDVLLFPLVESCLPVEIITAWQRSPNYGRDGSGEKPPKTELEFLMQLIKLEVEGEQQRGLAQNTFSIASNDHKGTKKAEVAKKGEKVPTAAGLFTGQSSECVFCDKAHPSHECFKAQGMTLVQKEQTIKDKRACLKCLKKGHWLKNCKTKSLKCLLCAKKHYTLMCPDLAANQKAKSQSQSVSEKNATVATNLNCTSSVLLKTLVVRALGKNSNQVVRLLFDDGSQRSYVKESTAKKLKLDSIGEEIMRKALFGGQSTETRRHQKYEVILESLQSRYRQKLNLIDEPTLCGRIPKVPPGPWISELKSKNIILTDCQEEVVDIEVLIGSDLCGRIMTGRVFKLQCGLIAMETVFGWTLSGPLFEESIAMTITALHVENSSVAELWNLDTLGIRDPIEAFSKEEKDRMVVAHFASTVKRKEDGRYSVSLPWTNGRQEVPNNRAVAEQRLKNTTTKLQRVNKVTAYHLIFKRWEDEGFIEAIEEAGVKDCHYLPHRAVFKPESKTTPIRPVFDASCKVGRNPSLNECLEKGPNLMELIPSVLLRFRERKVGFVSDIRKAFQMIEVEEDDRKFLKFLWWENANCEKVKVYQHRRVVFGLNSSPFLLHAVLNIT